MLVVGILIFSGFGAVFGNFESTRATSVENVMEISCEVSTPIIEDFDSEYISIDLGETQQYLLNPGEPVLPKIVKVLELPFGVKNVQVEAIGGNVKTYDVSKKVRPGPQFLPLTSIENTVVKPIEDEKIYSSEAYPNSLYSYRVGCGLNSDNERVTFVSIHVFPVSYLPLENKVEVTENIDIRLSYEEPVVNPLSGNGEYDLVIIAPPKFENDLQKLVTHKNNVGISTLLKTTEDIYNEFSGVDKPEEIKYFIKYAIEEWDISYVLIVGGLNSLIWAIPRDHNNYGDADWMVPIRYNNIYDNPKYPLDTLIRDPGVMCDLYYADIYDGVGDFSSWDPNGDGIFGAWDFPDDAIENDTGIDMMPDVAVGRLACRNSREVKLMTDKIIYYETHDVYNESWFKKMVSISGDGFLDQQDLDFQWDTTSEENGEYTIHGQSNNPEGDYGPIDEITVTIDKDVPTSLSFNHDDHLQFDTYPFDPITEITSPSNGDILGNTDFFYSPEENEAYCNLFLKWADVNFTDGVMHIRGKSYDPKPYGYTTDVHLWITDNNDEIVFEDWRYDTEMYFEGEWVTGERELKGSGGSLYYKPPDFTSELLWTSNGEFAVQNDVISSFNKGAGFMFFSGHGAPTIWGNHLAGVPGNRGNSHAYGLRIIDFSIPFLPMETLRNIYKTPIVVVGGCHNSQFNVSLIPSIFSHPSMWTHGAPAPECWSWWLTRLNKRGSIATIGNTGFGYGIIGEDCTSGGLDGGICIEFFRQYGLGNEYLGDAYSQTQVEYVNNFDVSLQEHAKSLQQWALLGDPSLKIGGYSTSSQQNLEIVMTEDPLPGENIEFQAIVLDGNNPDSVEWNFDLDDDGVYDTTIYGETVEESWASPGVYWVNVKATYGDDVVSFDTVVEIENYLDKPSTPSGKTNIKAGKTYTYSTRGTDPNDDGDLWYIFDWGDGEYGFSGPHRSGQIGLASHNWAEKGNYEIKVIVFDSYGRISPWSDPLPITITKSRSANNYPLFDILERFFNNHPNLFPLLQRFLDL